MNKKKIIFPLLLLVVWQIFSYIGLFSNNRVPSPIQIIIAIKHLFIAGLPSGKILVLHCAYSMHRVISGFLLGVAVAVPLGLLIGRSKYIRELLSPVIELLRPVPPLAWIPLAILWFGIGLKSATFIIFLGCFFPILLSTVSGVLSVDLILIDAARTLGAKEKDIFLKVLVPASTPSIYTGLRIGMGIGWMTLVAAEFTGVKSGYGLGYMIMTARDIQRPDFVIAGMVTIGFVGYMLDMLLRFMEAKSLRWR
jgi:ABC-type nitrate/sulfonate/bicarbonate transport system permease component